MEVSREEMLEFAKQATFHLDDRLVPYDREILRAEAWIAGYEFARRNGKREEKEPAPAEAPKPITEGSWVVHDKRICLVMKVYDDNMVLVADPSLFGNPQFLYDIADVRPWTLDDAKKGDILAVDEEMIFILEGAGDDICEYIACYDLKREKLYFNDVLGSFFEDKIRPATEGEKLILKEHIECYGLHWNPDKLELEEKPKNTTRAAFPQSDYAQLQQGINDLDVRIKTLEERVFRTETKDMPIGGNSSIIVR